MCDADDTPLTQAIRLVGMAPLSRELGVTHQAIRKWLAAGRMPRTEWTGETTYGAKIEELTDGKVTRDRLLTKWTAAPAGQAA
jgi:hypothetical protein